MGNTWVGSAYFITDTGLINLGTPMKINAIGFMGHNAAANLLLTIHGTPLCNIYYVNSTMQILPIGGIWVSTLSAQIVANCSGWLYLG